MKLVLAPFLIAGLLAVHTATAELENPNASPVFPSHQGSLSIADPELDQIRKECKELSRQIEALKGKPLRRAGLVEHYKSECQHEQR